MRDRILDTAFDLLHREGVKGLTQSKVARAAGVRQSHLTYYFPRKADLVAAVVARFASLAAERIGALDGREDPAGVIEALSRLVTDPAHMRLFLGLVVEAELEPSLREVLAKHVGEVNAAIAGHFGREPDDPAVARLLDYLRGRGLVRLLTRDEPPDDSAELARLFGLASGRTRKTRERPSRRTEP